jgi:hypothetical protein
MDVVRGFVVGLIRVPFMESRGPLQAQLPALPGAAAWLATPP